MQIKDQFTCSLTSYYLLFFCNKSVLITVIVRLLPMINKKKGLIRTYKTYLYLVLIINHWQSLSNPLLEWFNDTSFYFIQGTETKVQETKIFKQSKKKSTKTHSKKPHIHTKIFKQSNKKKSSKTKTKPHTHKNIFGKFPKDKYCQLIKFSHEIHVIHSVFKKSNSKFNVWKKSRH